MLPERFCPSHSRSELADREAGDHQYGDTVNGFVRLAGTLELCESIIETPGSRAA